MKKIFTLGLALCLTVAMFAADRRPIVTISSSKNYQLVIDGRTYMSMGSLSLQDLGNGKHTIQVYDAGRNFSFFSKRKQLVASSSFQLWNNNMMISIDRFGNISITEQKSGRDDYGKDQKGWDDRGKNSQGFDSHDKGNGRDYGKDNHDRKY